MIYTFKTQLYIIIDYGLKERQGNLFYEPIDDTFHFSAICENEINSLAEKLSLFLSLFSTSIEK